MKIARKAALSLALFPLLPLFPQATAAERPPFIRQLTGNLTLDGAVEIALRQNPAIRRSIQTIEQTRGQIISVRAQALPRLSLNTTYNQQDPGLLEDGGAIGAVNTGPTEVAIDPTQFSTIPGVTPVTANQIASTVEQSLSTILNSTNRGAAGGFAFNDKNWRVTVQAQQVLYAGGQVGAAIRIAKFTDDGSYFSLLDTIDRTIANVRQQFNNVLLTRALITVQEESVRLLQDQLKDQQNRFEAGTVPRFNVLQAEVALANQQPQLISARNNYAVAQYQLANSLGVDPGPQGQTTFNAVGELKVSERPLTLAAALQMGLERRPSLKVQRLNILIQKEQVKVALAGYKPQLSATGTYEWRNSNLSEQLDDTVNGWFFGITGRWNFFDGFETYGRVKTARANLESAKVTYDDTVNQVNLEVQQAFSNLQTARETIRSQQKTVEQALEAVRLATERLAAGAGTQLDVLNAQVQLTTARSTELQARANYNNALAEFDRVTATDTIYDNTFDDPVVRKRKPSSDPVIEKPVPVAAKKR